MTRDQIVSRLAILNHRLNQLGQTKMTTFNSAQLFNCCTDERAPDWSLFSQLEIGGCVTMVDETTGETFTEGLMDDSAAEFFTVYGRLHDGCSEAITDCKTRDRANAVALELSRISSLPVKD